MTEAQTQQAEAIRRMIETFFDTQRQYHAARGRLADNPDFMEMLEHEASANQVRDTIIREVKKLGISVPPFELQRTRSTDTKGRELAEAIEAGALPLFSACGIKTVAALLQFEAVTLDVDWKKIADNIQDKLLDVRGRGMRSLEEDELAAIRVGYSTVKETPKVTGPKLEEAAR